MSQPQGRRVYADNSMIQSQFHQVNRKALVAWSLVIVEGGIASYMCIEEHKRSFKNLTSVADFAGTTVTMEGLEVIN